MWYAEAFAHMYEQCEIALVLCKAQSLPLCEVLLQEFDNAWLFSLSSGITFCMTSKLLIAGYVDSKGPDAFIKIITHCSVILNSLCSLIYFTGISL